MSDLSPITATVARLILFIFATCLSTKAVFAADDPLVGKWKYDSDKSQSAGFVSRFVDAGGGSVRVIFGDDVDTFVLDGKYHPLKNGHTVAFSKTGPNKWKLLVKVNGKPLRTVNYNISKDERTLLMTVDNYQPNGPVLHQDMKSKRVGGTSGLFGSWQSVSNKMTPAMVMEISKWQGDGYSISMPADKYRLSLMLDGKEYEEKGPQVAKGAMVSGRRIDGRALEFTDKMNRKITDHARWKVSPDSSRLTVTTKYPGESKALVEVWERL